MCVIVMLVGMTAWCALGSEVTRFSLGALIGP